MEYASILLELAKLCRKASGPDRDLDQRIYAALHGWSYPLHGAAWVEFEQRQRERLDTDPTASFDAAIALVPKGWFWAADEKPPSSRVWTEGNVAYSVPRYDDEQRPATVILALCVAALQAQAAERA